MVRIDPARDAILTDHARSLLGKHYLRPGEAPQDGHARAATAWGSDEEHAQRLYDAASQHHFMWASPVLSNAPAPGEKIKALPISCFLSYVPDSIDGLCAHTTESRWLSVLGGGVGAHWSHVRSVSDLAPGPIPFIQTHDADMGAYRQGKVRRGSYAAYMDISHPDVEEFLSIRVPTGDDKRKCLGTGFHHAINITDDFMLAVARDRDWPLIDPHTGEERAPTANQGKRRLKARELWEAILETRHRTGEPYLCFLDTANAALPEALKAKGLRIHGSNLCSEIMLPTGPDRTAVCCLSSLNLEHYDEWKGTTLVGDMVEMLDNVLSHFIANAPPALANARRSAEAERSIGLGVMGWHAYLQKKGIPFESEEAVRLGEDIFRSIYQQAEERSLFLGMTRGEAPDMRGTGRRNAHLMAIAPTANSGTIAATSPSIELAKGNAYTHRTRAGSHLVKNRFLEKLLAEKGKDTDDVWQSIILNGGSVLHLDCLTPEEKAIFKTAIEVDQMWVIRHAAARQPWIDQGQSVNLFFPAEADRDYLRRVHTAAWEQGLKALYYLRTEATEKADAVGAKLERNKLRDAPEAEPAPVQPLQLAQGDECVACQG